MAKKHQTATPNPKMRILVIDDSPWNIESAKMTLAFEMVDTREKYDTAILMSGDSDFDVPIDKIKESGKRIIVMSTRGHISKELLERAKFIDLRKIKAEISQK